MFNLKVQFMWPLFNGNCVDTDQSPKNAVSGQSILLSHIYFRESKRVDGTNLGNMLKFALNVPTWKYCRNYHELNTSMRIAMYVLDMWFQDSRVMRCQALGKKYFDTLRGLTCNGNHRRIQRPISAFHLCVRIRSFWTNKLINTNINNTHVNK